MPRTEVRLYKEDDGAVPVREWLRNQHPRVVAKCLVKIERLRELGHELRRPEADLLRDGIHELRSSFEGVQYRLLYFFYKNIAAVVSHGIVKEQEVPSREIDAAIARKKRFELDPEVHSDLDQI